MQWDFNSFTHPPRVNKSEQATAIKGAPGLCLKDHDTVSHLENEEAIKNKSLIHYANHRRCPLGQTCEQYLGGQLSLVKQ